jgi:hypothetical protein
MPTQNQIRGQYATLLQLAAAHPYFSVGDDWCNLWPEETKDSFDRLFDTTIGACIFYLHQKKEDNFSGIISTQGLHYWVENQRTPVRDHINPRKKSARDLYEFLKYRHSEMTPMEWREFVLESGINEVMEFGKPTFFTFALVTTNENMRLKNWTHNFEDYKVAAENKGVQLFVPKTRDVPIHYNDLAAFVSYLRAHPLSNWDLDEIQNAYCLFNPAQA